MKRVITSLSLLLLLLCGAYAQDISQYEYWTDDDYTSRSVVSSSGGDVSFDVSTASLSAGIHFLNFRAKRSDEVWGNFYRYLYYIPNTQKSENAGNLRIEYWLDDDLTGIKSETAVNGDLSLSIDISTLKPGVHYFNCTPTSAIGERGNSERYLFYVPLPQEQTSASPIKGYEYWLDDDYAAKTVSNSGDESATLAISIDGLTSGVHYFNCRAFNERGEYGCPVRQLFYIAQKDASSAGRIAEWEYWIDNDVTHKVTGTDSKTEYVFSIDISGLAEGTHTFNFRAKDLLDRWSEQFVDQFVIPDIQKLFYMVDGLEYKTVTYAVGETIVPEPEPTKEGYTFSGWSEIPKVMPAHDVTVTGSFTVNKYKVTYMVNNVELKTEQLEYGATIIPPAKDNEGHEIMWNSHPTTMPAYDITIYGSVVTGIEEVTIDNGNALIFSIDGKQLNTPQKGVNILRTGDGKSRKIVVK